jgi:hypothetical protein
MFLEELGRTTKHLSEESRCSDRDSKWSPSEQMSEASPLSQPARCHKELSLTRNFVIYAGRLLVKDSEV